jgi:hypothetical protein
MTPRGIRIWECVWDLIDSRAWDRIDSRIWARVGARIGARIGARVRPQRAVAREREAVMR